MWRAAREALTAAEPALEPVFRTFEYDDSDDDLDEVELDEDPPEARNPDLAPLPATNITNYAQENPSYFARKTWLRFQASRASALEGL
jgi:hypothetical protein